jgi:hypothetical protein
MKNRKGRSPWDSINGGKFRSRPNDLPFCQQVLRFRQLFTVRSFKFLCFVSDSNFGTQVSEWISEQQESGRKASCASLEHTRSSCASLEHTMSSCASLQYIRASCEALGYRRPSCTSSAYRKSNLNLTTLIKIVIRERWVSLENEIMTDIRTTKTYIYKTLRVGLSVFFCCRCWYISICSVRELT